MASRNMYLDEITTATKDYKVKVKVVEKARPLTSPTKGGLVYQSLVLEDEKGNRVRGALFGDQIEGYKDAFMYNGSYEISNAPIKRLSSQWTPGPGEVDYQMSFGRRTVIQPVGDHVGPVLPNYLSLNQIPRAAAATERFDVLGVILYTEPEPQTTKTPFSTEKLRREIVIMDHSMKKPVIVNVWADLAQAELPFLHSWAEKFSVVGFTALKVYTLKGFSLSSSMSTVILEEPVGDRAKVLTEWVSRHQNLLADVQARVLAARDPTQQGAMTTIAELKRKKADTTLPEERLRLRVQIAEAELEKVNAYLGCSYCNTSDNTPLGKIYECGACHRKDSVSSPKVTFNCDVTDGTGNFAITTFSGTSHKLFKVSDAHMFKIKHDANIEAFRVIQERLQSTYFIVEIGPNANLARNNVLQWVLKDIHNDLEETTEEDESKHQEQQPGDTATEETSESGEKKSASTNKPANNNTQNMQTKTRGQENDSSNDNQSNTPSA